MKLNPIYRKDELSSARSLTLPAVITGVNLVLAILVVINLFATCMRAQNSGEIPYRDYLRVYYAAAAIEYVFLLLIAPLLSAPAISGERENGMLGLLLSTQLGPWDIISGKLMSAMGTLLLLLITTFPQMATAFLFGGITLMDAMGYILFLVVSDLYAVCIGLLSGVSTTTRGAAIAVSYTGVCTSMIIGIGAFFMHDAFYAPWQNIYYWEVGIMLVLSVLCVFIAARLLSPKRGHRIRLR